MKWVSSFIFILLVHTLFSQSADPQSWLQAKNRIGISLGIGSVAYVDRNVSPLIYQSRPKNLKLYYTREIQNLMFTADLDLKIGGNAPKQFKNRTLYFQEEDYKGNKDEKKFPAGGTFIAGRVSIGAHYKVPATMTNSTRVAAGIRVMNEMFYPQGWTTGGIFNATSLSPEVLVQHRFNNQHNVNASFKLPMLARVTRLPYDNTVSSPNTGTIEGFFKNSSSEGLKHFFNPSFNLNYNYLFASRWGVGLNYDFSYYNIQKSGILKATNQSLLANFFHQF